MSDPISERAFTMADQEAFAALSGDRNPMHMDAAAARRTQAGAPAVHGVHGALWALDRLAAHGVPLDRLARLKVDFQRFLHLDRPTALAIVRGEDDTVVATLLQDGATATTLDLRLAAPPAAPAADTPDAEAVPPAPPAPLVPEAPDFAALEGREGRIGAPPEARRRAAAAFPAAVRALGTEAIVDIALLSTMVGMAVPGLHSIFSGFTLDRTAPGTGPGLGYRVTQADSRFRVVALAVAAAGFTGSARTFARFPPVAPADMATLAGRVAPDTFAGRRALVIGGSRGLGAATAMLLAAGGADVTFTFRSGASEARAVCARIAAAGDAARCRAFAYDAAADPAGQLVDMPAPLTHLYYFATGRIFGQQTAVLDPGRLAAFLEVYVTGFHALLAHLLDRQPGAPLHALWPSSVAVETRPRGMTEYAMAKAAGEILAADLARAHRGLTIAAPRLPRILTDQTATVPPVPAQDPVEVMLPLLLAEGR